MDLFRETSNYELTSATVYEIQYRLQQYVLKRSNIMLNKKNAQILSDFSAQLIKKLPHYSIQGNRESSVALSQEVREILDTLVVVSQLPGIKNTFVRTLAPIVFETITVEFINEWCGKEILRNFNVVIQNSDKNLRHQLIADNNLIHLYKLVDLLSVCGDYEYQTIIMECIHRMCTKNMLMKYSKELIPEDDEMRKAFVDINKESFDQDVRKFLNIVNEKSKNVYSVICDDVLIDDIKLPGPYEYQIDGLWVDFNTKFRTISWYVDESVYNSANHVLYLLPLQSIKNVVIESVENNNIKILFKLKGKIITDLPNVLTPKRVELVMQKTEKALLICTTISKQYEETYSSVFSDIEPFEDKKSFRALINTIKTNKQKLRMLTRNKLQADVVEITSNEDSEILYMKNCLDNDDDISSDDFNPVEAKLVLTDQREEESEYYTAQMKDSDKSKYTENERFGNVKIGRCVYNKQSVYITDWVNSLEPLVQLDNSKENGVNPGITKLQKISVNKRKLNPKCCFKQQHCQMKFYDPQKNNKKRKLSRSNSSNKDIITDSDYEYFTTSAANNSLQEIVTSTDEVLKNVDECRDKEVLSNMESKTESGLDDRSDDNVLPTKSTVIFNKIQVNSDLIDKTNEPNNENCIQAVGNISDYEDMTINVKCSENSTKQTADEINCTDHCEREVTLVQKQDSVLVNEFKATHLKEEKRNDGYVSDNKKIKEFSTLSTETEAVDNNQDSDIKNEAMEICSQISTVNLSNENELQAIVKQTAAEINCTEYCERKVTLIQKQGSNLFGGFEVTHLEKEKRNDTDNKKVEEFSTLITETEIVLNNQDSHCKNKAMKICSQISTINLNNENELQALENVSVYKNSPISAECNKISTKQIENKINYTKCCEKEVIPQTATTEFVRQVSSSHHSNEGDAQQLFFGELKKFDTQEKENNSISVVESSSLFDDGTKHVNGIANEKGSTEVSPKTSANTDVSISQSVVIPEQRKDKSEVDNMHVTSLIQKEKTPTEQINYEEVTSTPTKKRLPFSQEVQVTSQTENWSASSSHCIDELNQEQVNPERAARSTSEFQELNSRDFANTSVTAELHQTDSKLSKLSQNKDILSANTSDKKQYNKNTYKFATENDILPVTRKCHLNEKIHNDSGIKDGTDFFVPVNAVEENKNHKQDNFENFISHKESLVEEIEIISQVLAEKSSQESQSNNEYVDLSSTNLQESVRHDIVNEITLNKSKLFVKIDRCDISTLVRNTETHQTSSQVTKYSEDQDLSSPIIINRMQRKRSCFVSVIEDDSLSSTNENNSTYLNEKDTVKGLNVPEIVTNVTLSPSHITVKDNLEGHKEQAENIGKKLSPTKRPQSKLITPVKLQILSENDILLESGKEDALPQSHEDNNKALLVTDASISSVIMTSRDTTDQETIKDTFKDVAIEKQFRKLQAIEHEKTSINNMSGEIVTHLKTAQENNKKSSVLPNKIQQKNELKEIVQVEKILKTDNTKEKSIESDIIMNDLEDVEEESKTILTKSTTSSSKRRKLFVPDDLTYMQTLLDITKNNEKIKAKTIVSDVDSNVDKTILKHKHNVRCGMNTKHKSHFVTDTFFEHKRQKLQITSSEDTKIHKCSHWKQHKNKREFELKFDLDELLAGVKKRFEQIKKTLRKEERRQQEQGWKQEEKQQQRLRHSTERKRSAKKTEKQKSYSYNMFKFTPIHTLCESEDEKDLKDRSAASKKGRKINVISNIVLQKGMQPYIDSKEEPQKQKIGHDTIFAKMNKIHQLSLSTTPLCTDALASTPSLITDRK